MKTIDQDKLSSIWEKRDLLRNDLTSQPPRFIDYNSSLLISNIICSLESVLNFKEVNYIKGSHDYLDSEIIFHNTKYREWNIYKDPLKKINDCKFIFGDFPFGISHRAPFPGDWKKVSKTDSSTSFIIGSADMLSNDGFGLFMSLPYQKTFVIDKLRENLAEKNSYVNAIIIPPKNFLRPYTGLVPLLVLVSKNKTSKEFILSIEDSKNVYFDLNNMFNKKDKKKSIFIDYNLKNINDGIWIEPGKFEGIDVYNINKKIKSLDGDYKKFGSMKLEDLCAQMKTLGGGGKPEKNFEELDDTVYMPLIGKQNSCLSIKEFVNKPHNYIQLVIDTDKILPAYLKNYLNSSYGKIFRQLEIDKMGSVVIPRLSKKSAGQILVRVPDIKEQEVLISIVSDIDKLQKNVKDLGENILKNPISDQFSLSKMRTLLVSLNLATGDELIKNLILSDESKTVEFKQTITYCLRTKKREQYITDSWVKTIAAFLNTNGGSLLVGISDKKEVVGLDHEMQTFFKQGGQNNNDNLLKYVKNIIKDYIGEEFYPYIEFNLHNVEEKKILWVKCKASDKPVWIKGEDFYVRSNPATDKLVGDKQYSYILARFETRK